MEKSDIYIPPVTSDRSTGGDGLRKEKVEEIIKEEWHVNTDDNKKPDSKPTITHSNAPKQ
ncbi:hypothetical protein HY029_00100 [Candidatus Gottesmanbacteria bacterium]|nr:hypothetical protein [Candidatus Gottesmanbacteria bacterium]